MPAGGDPCNHLDGARRTWSSQAGEEEEEGRGQRTLLRRQSDRASQRKDVTTRNRDSRGTRFRC